MTGQRDFERTLDAWFVDGPSVMPDRVFDAVLDQVERTPQRRLARLRLRLTEMTPKIRLFTVLAAALVAVLAGIALIGGGSTIPVSASPSPTAASGTDSPLPTTLVGHWSGGDRSIAGLEPGAGVRLTFDETGFAFSQINRAADTLAEGAASASDAGAFLVRAVNSDMGCTVGQEGRYGFDLSSSGRTLTIAADVEACAAREAAFVGTWQVDACPNPDGICLGALDPGEHASHAFDPFVPIGGVWRPRYAAFTYTVPEGWANADDWPTTYSLLPRREFDTYDPSTCGRICPDAITLLAHASAAEQGNTCLAQAEPGVGRTAADLVDWLTSLQGLDASTEQVTVDGVRVTAVDISVADDWTGTCPETPEPIVGLPLLTEVGGWHWAIFAGDRYRIIPLDLADGATVVIAIDTRDAATFDAFVTEAMPVVESFAFAP
jgi:hypothetical protein